jgi:DNA-binding beta-propeller fold protein YncE
MKTVSLAAIAATVCVTGLLQISAADTARFRHLASVYADGAGASLKRPEGVACDATGQVVVADTGNGRLVRFTYRNKTLTPGAETRVPQLTAPVRVQINSKGDIYALDGKQRRIVHLGPDGAFRDFVTFDGAPAPATIVVKSFAIDAADHLYVLDVFSARVLVLDASGRFQKSLALPGAASFITDIAVDAGGTVLALDSISRRLHASAKDAGAFSPLGGDLGDAVLTMPTSLATSRGLIFVVEGSGGAIASLGQDGAFVGRQLTHGWQEGSLNHPAQVCVTDADEMVVADRDNSRVQVFGLTR